MVASGGLEVWFPNWGRGRGVRLEDRVQMTNTGTSWHWRQSEAREAGRSWELELTWSRGRRRALQPFRFRVLRAPTWAAGVGKGAGEREGRSRAKGAEEWGDRRK
jgi:hypothetical protein